MKTQQVSDCELVSLYKKGEEQAFAQLVQRHKNKIFTTIMLIVRDRDVAEDLLQETFAKAVVTIKTGRYNEEGKFLPWISRIAHNMAIDYFRRQKRYPVTQMEDHARDLDAAGLVEDCYETVQIQKETYAKLRGLIKQLPPAQREVLMMRHYMQMSFQEIADATGVSINTALGRMRYALINLRKQLNHSEAQYAQNLFAN
jgi:RNA polymerase sigma factor (sigma-70 family)